MPSSLMARFAPDGMYQTTRPMRPSQLSKIAATSGPPASPSRTGTGRPGMAMGIRPGNDTRRDPGKDG